MEFEFHRPQRCLDTGKKLHFVSVFLILCVIVHGVLYFSHNNLRDIYELTENGSYLIQLWFFAVLAFWIIRTIASSLTDPVLKVTDEYVERSIGREKKKFIFRDATEIIFVRDKNGQLWIIRCKTGSKEFHITDFDQMESVANHIQKQLNKNVKIINVNERGMHEKPEKS